MTDKISPTMLAALRDLAGELKRSGAHCARIRGSTGRSLHMRNLVDKIFVATSPWEHYRPTPEGLALLEKEGLLP
jgi:hypothetical protein